jgi:plastocyanin
MVRPGGKGKSENPGGSMEKTTRRNLLKAAAVGGVTATGLAAMVTGTSSAAAQQPGRGNEHAHDNRRNSGKRALAVVSFGQWDANVALPFDRHPIDTEAERRTRNIHLVLPFRAEVDAGGAVSFTISGVHQILIYAGREYADVKAAWEAAGSPVLPVGPGLVDYATDRVYRGLSPFALQYLLLDAPTPETPNNLVVDRLETVNFREPGRYLVVCGVRPHFNEGMHGYVTVKA